MEIGQVPGGGRPFGDIYSFNTPHIDQMGQQLYAEQKQRELVHQKKAAALDEEFRKNMSNIKDADIPEFSKRYNDYKNAKKGLIKMTPSSSDDYIKAQLDAQQKLASIYELTNASKQAKDEESQLGKALLTNPTLFDDNAGELLTARRRTPIAGLKTYQSKDANGNPVTLDLSNPSTYKYKGTNTDFQKIEKAASGDIKTTVPKEEMLDGGLQIKTTPYMFGNTPADFAHNFIGALYQHQAGRDASAIWDSIPQATKDAINKEYDNIPLDKWEKMTGKREAQKLEVSNPDNKAEQFAVYKAKLYALNNEPREGTPVLRENKIAVMAAQEQKERRMEALSHSYRMGEKQFEHTLKGVDDGTKDLWIDNHVQGLIDDAKQQNDKRELTFKGEKIHGYKIQMDPVLRKSLGMDDKNPGELMVTDDGKFYPLYYNTDKWATPEKVGDGLSVDANRTYAITPEQLKLALGKTSAGVKQVNTEMTAKKSAAPVTTSQTYHYKGKTYTNAQLKAAADQSGMTIEEYKKELGLK